MQMNLYKSGTTEVGSMSVACTGASMDEPIPALTSPTFSLNWKLYFEWTSLFGIRKTSEAGGLSLQI